MEHRDASQDAEDLKLVESSIAKLNANLDELNQRKADLLDKMQCLSERDDEEDADTVMQSLFSLLKSLKAFERQEYTLQSQCKEECSKLQAEANELQEILPSGNDVGRSSNGLDHTLQNAIKRLNSAKRELAAKLREIVLLKRQHGDVPSQAELVQYERRFSELYVHIQDKHRRTRKLYATFNALLEIKELMLKETSLLNSISSQFQDAIISTTGRVKLIDSIERISSGIEQKLGQVQLALQAEQKVCDDLKDKYAAAISEQRFCNSRLKTFQEECVKNERLQSQTADTLV